MASTGDIESADVKREFTKVVNAFSQNSSVAVGGGKGFGAGALKVDGKIFAMLDSKNQFVVKLPKKRVDELIASGAGIPFEPRPGKPMKEWLVITAARSDWAKLAKEAHAFVGGGRS